MHTLIFTRADGTIFGENDSPGILKCYVPQEFVIEWGAGKAVYIQLIPIEEHANSRNYI